MMDKRIFALMLSIAIMLQIFPVMVWADDTTEVYTEFTGGNSNHSGNGTKESPYNLFEDALEAVADGGTIYIGENGAFVNDESDGQPLKITKNVTITGNPDIISRPILDMRKGGLVLGADVKFSNIILSFSNANHAAVFANGYTLELDNVSHSPNTRIIHLAGGSLYDKYGDSLSPAAGSYSKIIISGKSTQFGNIYAGSINGDFDRNVDIILNEVSGSAIGKIYSSGAEEGHYNSANILDPYNEPEEPFAYAPAYPVEGAVSIELNNSYIRRIDGKTGGDCNASLAVSVKYLYECDLDNIKNLTVKEGAFAPRTINEDVNVCVQSGGTLDMSLISDCTVNDFNGNNGILIIGKTGSMTIGGLCTGSAELRTPSGSSETSGIAEYDHLYIITTGNGEFEFTPYSTQEGMQLNKTDEGWRTSVKPEYDEKTVLTEFDITTPAIVTTVSQINGKREDNTIIPIGIKFTEDTTYEDIGAVPLEYKVTYNGTIFGPVKSIEDQGYYTGVISELHLNFWAQSWGDISEIVVLNWSDVSQNTGDIAAGVYDIEITAPTEAGDVTCSVRLTVVEEEMVGDTATQTDISLSTENITYNGCVNVSANVAADGQEITEGSSVLYINGKAYLNAVTDGIAQWQDIPVTFENGFKIGLNQLTVRYNGSEQYEASQSEIPLAINKATVTIKYEGVDTTVDYTGKSMDVNFDEFSFVDESGKMIVIDAVPEITYTDGQGNTVNPINPGIYTAKLNLPEGDCYYAIAEQIGHKLTINAAKPSVILNIADTDEGGAELTAEVRGPIGGYIPTGSIEVIDRTDSTSVGTASLEGGTAGIKLTNLSYGGHVFYAVYVPDTNAPYISTNSADVNVDVAEPTATPTAAPTATPTVAPTATPTVEPTATPTIAPTATPTVAPTATPTVEPTATPTAAPIIEKTWVVNGIETGMIDVTFTNLTGKNIENAAMIIAVYDADGALQRIEKNNVNTKAGDKQTFSFNLNEIQCEKVKIFIWNSLEQMIPVCEAYKSWQ